MLTVEPLTTGGDFSKILGAPKGLGEGVAITGDIIGVSQLFAGTCPGCSTRLRLCPCVYVCMRVCLHAYVCLYACGFDYVHVCICLYIYLLSFLSDFYSLLIYM